MSNHIDQDSVLLVGAGPMAVSYAMVLQAQGISCDVIGRGAHSAGNFTAETGVPAHTGGIDSWLKEDRALPRTAIVSVNVEQLAHTTLRLLDEGVKRILVEKPAGLNRAEISLLAEKAQREAADVFVAYNRRFYASTLKAQEIIAQDGGAISFNFEFTEWSHIIADLQKARAVKEEWFLANSTHVVDLAFFLGGKPRTMSCYTSGGLGWHPRASIYAGAGVSESGALFSYQANWEAPGRWGVEILTRKHRVIFRPMEELHIQRVGSVAVEKVDIDDELDRRFKHGLYRQVEAFLYGKDAFRLLMVREHLGNTEFYDRMEKRTEETSSCQPAVREVSDHGKRIH